jgi:hypothetical protein
MFPEKHQAIAVNFNGAPGMGLDEVGKILFALFRSQLIGTTIKLFTHPAHSARVRINGLWTFSLELEHAQMTLIKFIKSIRFSLIHGIPPFEVMVTGIGHCWELYTDLEFFSAA